MGKRIDFLWPTIGSILLDQAQTPLPPRFESPPAHPSYSGNVSTLTAKLRSCPFNKVGICFRGSVLVKRIKSRCPIQSKNDNFVVILGQPEKEIVNQCRSLNRCIHDRLKSQDRRKSHPAPPFPTTLPGDPCSLSSNDEPGLPHSPETTHIYKDRIPDLRCSTEV